MTALVPGVEERRRQGQPPPFIAAPLARTRFALASWSTRAMLGVGGLAAVLFLWNLTISGYANQYYSAAALAASQSWSAWFFGSLDASNFITVDKPPLATMLMGLSVRLLGLSSWSILLPQALLGVGSVVLLFAIVRRQFGTVAATIAGIVLALTPVAVLMFRYNHPDALLTFLMLLGAYGTQRAIEHGRHRWLVLAGISVGLAFLAKYLQGFLVGPALMLAYVVAANASLRRRIAGVAVFSASTLLTAGAWVAAVELTPASLRPFIGGSTNNSVLDLVFGYDGLGRIFGGSAGNGGGANFSGTPGILRLFNTEFGGQIAWLLPFAVVAATTGLVLTLRARRTDLGRAAYLLWGGWLAVHAVVFSFMSGIVHSYYAVALAPAIGALVGAGTVALWRLRERYWFGGLALGGLVLGSATLSALLLGRSPDFVPWLAPAVIAAGAVAAGLIAMPALRTAPRWVGASIGALGLAAILAGPAAFSLSTVATAYSGSIVSAGPQATVSDALSGGGSNGAGGGPGGFPGGQGGNGGFALGGTPPTDDSALVQYLLANQGSAKWVVAVSDAMSAAQLEIASGQPVMATGGWSGSDNALSLDQLEAYVASGDLRFVEIGGQGGFGGRGSSSEIAAWVEANGTAVTIDGSSTTIYDLSGAVGA